jgi:hypothetical protein
MLFGRPWFKDVKIAHDWHMITIQGNGTVQTIVMIKHAGTNMKRPKVLLWFHYQNGITYEEKELIFVNELVFLFSIGTISLPL